MGLLRVQHTKRGTGVRHGRHRSDRCGGGQTRSVMAEAPTCRGGERWRSSCSACICKGQWGRAREEGPRGETRAMRDGRMWDVERRVRWERGDRRGKKRMHTRRDWSRLHLTRLQLVQALNRPTTHTQACKRMATRARLLMHIPWFSLPPLGAARHRWPRHACPKKHAQR